MCSAITKALQEVQFRIPRQVLDLVFVKRTQQWRQAPLSIDEQMMNLVVRPRVLYDCNLVGGTEAYIPLERVPFERTDDYTSVYRIPKELTQGRSILSALSVTFTNPTRASMYGAMAGVNNNTMLQMGSNVMDAMGSSPLTSTAYVQLIAENVVMVRETTVLPSNIYLRCVLMNDENMSHIQLRSYHAFSELVTLAIKAYIYNTYVIQMDIGELLGGQNLGRIKEIIDGYADADELYRTYLREKWAKIAFMNDTATSTRFLKMIIGGGR